jgi:methionine synthase II (cobalamin-independent)
MREHGLTMSHPRTSPPFRAEHVGCLLRPAELLSKRRAGAAEEELRAAEDAAILEAIRLQEEVGLQSITDGEFRRGKYFTHFAKAVDGFATTEGSVTFHDESGEPMRYTTDVIVGRLRRVRGIATDEFAFVREDAEGGAPRLGEGDYEPVAEQVFGRVAVDVLLLEYDTDRAGGFEPLRFLAPDTTAVLGLISTKTPLLERKDDVLRRIDEASSFVPLERLAVSPQCGFASVEEGNPISPDDQRRKLELVVDVAEAVWNGV